MMSRRRQPRPPRRASILLVVLLVIALMTVSGMAYFEWTYTEHRASEMYARQVQTRALADSGVEYVKTALMLTPTMIEQEGGLYDNPRWFRGVLLADSDAAALRARFGVVAPAVDGGEYLGYRFGLEDESARLNLNTLLLADEYTEGAARMQLMYLPGMTQAIADAILDWIDEDDEPRTFGAERNYYSALENPREPQNGPLESIEQLLQVRDVTPTLLYGLDQDRNMVLSEREAAGVLPSTVDNSMGAMNRGWAAYFTLYSAESNLDETGAPKIDVNMEDLEELHSQLSTVLGAEEANFIIAYRQGGAADEDATGQQVPAGSLNVDFEQPGSETIESLLSLIGVNAEAAQGNGTVIVQTPFSENPGAMLSYLPNMLDTLTVGAGQALPGRLNINQAPRALLQGIPNMPLGAVEQIIAARNPEVTPDQPERRYGEWLLMEGILSLEEMKAIAPLVTGQGDVYRAQIIGFFDDQGPATRVEVVIDDTGVIPQVLHQRNLTPLGAGFTAAELGATGPNGEQAPLGGPESGYNALSY